MKEKLYNFLSKIRCKIGMHSDEHWNKERCDKEGLMFGVFAPSTCLICGRTTQKFKWPPQSIPGAEFVNNEKEGEGMKVNSLKLLKLLPLFAMIFAFSVMLLYSLGIPDRHWFHKPDFTQYVKLYEVKVDDKSEYIIKERVMGFIWLESPFKERTLERALESKADHIRWFEEAWARAHAKISAPVLIK